VLQKTFYNLDRILLEILKQKRLFSYSADSHRNCWDVFGEPGTIDFALEAEGLVGFGDLVAMSSPR
jgi:hypothetical protein